MTDIFKLPCVINPDINNIDLIFRVSGCFDTKKVRHYNISVINTDDIKSRANIIQESLSFKIGVLRDVIISQKKLIDYNGIYNSYLMNHITEDAFYEEAEKFCYDPIQVNPQELAAKIACLSEETNIEYTEAELTSLFGCSESSTKEALASFIKPDKANDKLAWNLIK